MSGVVTNMSKIQSESNSQPSVNVIENAIVVTNMSKIQSEPSVFCEFGEAKAVHNRLGKRKVHEGLRLRRTPCGCVD